MKSESSKKDLRNLLIVLGSALLIGIAFSLFLIYEFGPSGKYVVKHALLSPSLVSDLSYDSLNPKTGGLSRFVFENIEFTNKKESLFIEVETYKKIYHLIKNDESLLSPSSDILSLFKNPATIKINARTESHAHWQDEKTVFQKINFSNDGNYYSIELREEKSTKGETIYFHHPDIYKKVVQIVIP